MDNNKIINFQNSAVLNKQRFERDFNYNNTTVLVLELENYIVETQNKIVAAKINGELEKQATTFMKEAITNLYPNAVKDFINSTTNTYPFMPYATMLKYTPTYNKNCHLSLYNDNYVFTGGAHGTTLRKSNTFSLKTGSQLPLSSFFSKNINYKEVVLTEILRQANERQQQNPGIFFDDYKDLIMQTFNEKSFYLTDDGIVIYFGQYDIAPYVSGIQEFTIPYSMVTYPPKC